MALLAPTYTAGVPAFGPTAFGAPAFGAPTFGAPVVAAPAVAPVVAELPVAQAEVINYAPLVEYQPTIATVSPTPAGPFVPGPTTLAPTQIGTSFVNGDHHPKATVYAPVNPLRKFDFDRKRRAPLGAATQMVRVPTPADVATDPGSNTLANRLFDPWYPAAGNSRPYFQGLPYDWAGYWQGNSIIRGW